MKRVCFHDDPRQPHQQQRMACGAHNLYRLGWALLLLLTGTGTLAPAAEYYKWVDEDGNVNYSTQPPPSQEAETVLIRKDSADPERQRQLQTQHQELEQRRQDQQQQRQDASKEQEDRQIAAQNCKRARERLQALNVNRRLYTQKDDGSFLYYTPEQEEAARQEARELIAKYCQ